jgi:hypothetical protein
MEVHKFVRRRGSHIFKTVKSKMAMGLSALQAGHPAPPGRFLGLISVRDVVDLRSVGDALD